MMFRSSWGKSRKQRLAGFAAVESSSIVAIVRRQSWRKFVCSIWKGIRWRYINLVC